MRRKKVILLAFCAVCLFAFSAAIAGNKILAAPAEPAEGFAIPWWTVDTGGGTSQGSSFALNGTIGQPDAGSLSGGSYTLKGGYWGGSIDYISYLPLINR